MIHGRRLATGLLLTATILGASHASVAAPQAILDQVLVKFGNEIVTQLDVRQARLLKLVDVPNDTDQAYIDALVDRRLILSDLRRTVPAEPSPEAVATRMREWRDHLGPGANVADLLARAGMTDAGLRGWIHDDVWIKNYLEQRFAVSTSGTQAVTAWVAQLRQRAGLQ